MRQPVTLVSEEVLPHSASVNSLGHLEIGGCDTVHLAEKWGTPLFVYDEATIRRQCLTYREAFSRLYPESEVAYAGKAFICKAVCRLVAEEGLSLDVASGGELYTALAAGFPPERILLHGNNKGRDELEQALGAGVGRIIVDSFQELDLLEELLSGPSDGQRKGGPATGPGTSLLVRLTPGIKVDTHEYLDTGGMDCKFGFPLIDGVAREAIERARRLPLPLEGVHIHIGSQIFSLHSFGKAIEIVADFLAEVRGQTGWEAATWDLGGGLGISYRSEDVPSTVEELAEITTGEVRGQCKRLGLPLPKVVVEPGRSIVGRAGVTLYRVGTIKEVPKVRTYVSVDGGMSDNLRPMLYGAVYESLLANRAGEKRTEEVAVAGKHCETGDVLIKEAHLPSPREGDILLIPATGAYGYAMANNYNRQPRPAVVMVGEGSSRLIVRRESLEDVVRLDAG